MAANDDVRLHGKNGAIYVNGPKGTGTRVSAKSQWDLNLGRDYVEVTAFGDTNKRYLAGLKDVSGTFNGFLDVSGDIMVNQTNLDDVPIYLYADDRDGSEILVASGLGLIDTSISLSNADAARVSGNFRASSDWAVFSNGSL